MTVAGNFEEQQKAFRELVISLLLALVLVYMVLACQYESLRDPVIVMAEGKVLAVPHPKFVFPDGETKVIGAMGGQPWVINAFFTGFQGSI